MSRRARVLWVFVGLSISLLLLTDRSVTIAQSATKTSRRPQTSRSHAGNSQLAVDVVKLKSGKTLRGAIAHADPDGSLTMAVSREWLRHADPKLLADTEAKESRGRKPLVEQLRDRIVQELARVPEDSGVATFLRLERKRVESLLAEDGPAERPQFVWIDLTAKETARVKTASNPLKEICGWSWHEQLPNVETRDAADLTRELRRKKIDVTQPCPSLADRLPLRSQDEQEWSARMGLISYSLGKPLDFQGTGDLLMRVDPEKKGADVAPMIAKLLGAQMDALVKDLLSEGRGPAGPAKSPDTWLESAIRQAEQEKARVFRATRVDLSLEPRQAAVQSVFVVRLANGKWQTLWSDSDTQDGAQERAALEGEISNDPQIKSALGLLKSLGTNGDDQIRSAIRLGAATTVAQQHVNNHFQRFQEPFLRQLDGPPLWWPR